MSNIIHNNKGVALILMLGLSSVLYILGIGFISSNIQEGNLTRRYNDSIAALYQAEKGISYAFIEAMNAGFNWVTHQTDTEDSNRNGDTTELIPTGIMPSLSFAGQGAAIDDDGNYTIPSENGRIRLKSYIDPNNQDEIIMLCQSTVGSSQRIVKFRISVNSLFKHLFFFPTSTVFDGNYDGQGIGGIHVNGDIILNSPTFKELSDLTAAGYIYYENEQHPAPYEVDDRDGIRDGLATMPKDPYPPYHYYMEHEAVYSLEKHFSSGATIVDKGRNIAIPNELSTEWQWDKYSGVDRSKNPGGKPELPVTFIVPKEELDRVKAADSNDYWRKAYGKDPDWVNEEWWQDKVYGDDRKISETIPVKFTNSQYQPDDWKDFITDKGLDSIIHEKNTGGKFLNPLNIESNYPDLAKKNGLYVGKDNKGKLEIYLNGSKINSLPAYVKDNVQFFNTERPQLDSRTKQPLKENVLEIDVEKINSDGKNRPKNNIVYIAHKDVRLVNGKVLPPGGLTMVSPYNVYIKGNYNYDPDKSKKQNDVNWQPAAVITNSLVYTLSGKFNDPQQLPMSTDYLEYPYSLEFSDFLDRYCEGAQYPAKLIKAGKIPPGGQLTWDWIKKNLTGLQQETLLISGEGYYDFDNTRFMPNVADKTTYYNTAIVSPREPSPNTLERWENGAKVIVTGAFIKLEKDWSSSGVVPVTYNRGAKKGWGGKYSTYGLSVNYIYESRFWGQDSRRPSGDFLAGSQGAWQVVSDFEHN